jgi:AraC-like DNA-binding protein
MTFAVNKVSFDAYFLDYHSGVAATLKPITVSVNLLSQMFLYLDSLKVDINAFLRSIDVNPGAVKSPDARIPIEIYLRIQDEAAEYVNDPYFGLHMGEFAEAGSWSILGYMLMNCKNLGEAFEKSERYSRIIGNLIEARTELRPNTVKVNFQTAPHAPKMSRHCFDASFSSSIRMIRSLTGVELHPLEVSFIYPEPDSKSEYERIFKCPVVFGQRDNSYTMDMNVVNTPIPMANPALLEYFEQYAQDFLTEMDRNDEHTRAVTKIILSKLDDEALSINQVAQEMAVSVRTLQKRLEEEGVVFSDLYKGIRHQLAQKYLRENYTVEQITYLLGFSEPSVFRKAFKKWSGITPGEFRERSFSATTRI